MIALTISASTMGWAQPEGAEGDAGMAPAETSEAASEESSEAAAKPDEAMAAEPVAASRWARDIISRVLTYPKGVGTVGLDLATSTSSFFDPAFVRILGGYGITDDFELNFGHYSFATSDAGKGSIDVGLGYKLLRGAAGGKLEAIARVQTGYSLATEGLNPLALGVHAQYNITPKLAVITPGGQLSVALDGDPKPVTLGVPVSVGFQATPLLYLQADTTLATFSISNSANTFIFADSTPLFLGGYYNVSAPIDVFAGLGMNLTPPVGGVGDTLGVLVGGRYYFGQL